MKRFGLSLQCQTSKARKMSNTAAVPVVTATTVNGTTYTAVQIKVSGNVFSFMQVSGRFNYVNITKVTNNPFRTSGKQFDSWADAEAAYKSPEMQIAILSAQTIL
jgi:hypothetical protein